MEVTMILAVMAIYFILITIYCTIIRNELIDIKYEIEEMNLRQKRNMETQLLLIKSLKTMYETGDDNEHNNQI